MCDECRKKYEEEFWNDYKKIISYPVKSNVYNYFVCGNIKSRIDAHNLIVIGDVISNDINVTNKITLISPELKNDVLMKVLDREAQRGSWESIDEFLHGKNVKNIRSSDYSMALLRVFSLCMHKIEKLNDDNFYNALKRMVNAIDEKEGN